MTDIAPPKHGPDDPDRGIDCEFSLEPAFQAMADQAEAAGWTEDEVSCALLGLAKARIMMLIENRKTEAGISDARKAGGH